MDLLHLLIQVLHAGNDSLRILGITKDSEAVCCSQQQQVSNVGNSYYFRGSLFDSGKPLMSKHTRET